MLRQTPFVLVDTTQDIEQRKALMRSISPSLRLQLNLQSIVARCCKALLEIGLQNMSEDSERAMDVLLGVFVAQIKDIEHESTSGES